MIRLFKKLDISNKKAFVGTVILGVFAASIFTFNLLGAAGPEFNRFPISYNSASNTDLPLLDGRNSSRGESWSANQQDHDAGVKVKPGETVQFSIYYHNGAPDILENIAKNTVIWAQANPNSGTNAAQHVISAFISADNAATVGSASKGGNITVISEDGQPVKLSLVPGSVKIFRDRGLNPSAPAEALSDSIFAGVNIGDVRGCFEFHGFVKFEMQVERDAEPEPEPEEPPFNPVCEFTWREPTLPDGRGLRKTGEPSNVQMNVFGLRPNQAFKVINTHSSGSPVFESELSVNSQGNFSAFDTTIIPSGYIPGDYNTIVKWNTSVPCTSFRIVEAAPPAEDFELSVAKQVRNISQTQSAFRNSVSAEPGERVEFKISVSTANSDSAQTNVFLKDTISRDNLLTFRGGTLKIDGTPVPNGNRIFAGSGINMGHMQANTSKEIIFEADVAGVNFFNPGETVNIVNTAQARSDQAGPVQDQASVNVTAPQQPIQEERTLSIVKSVRNVSDNESAFSQRTSADPGEEVEFRIIVGTGGNASQSNVTVSDILPGKLMFVSGDDLRGSGENLGTVLEGKNRTFNFIARVDGAGSFSTGTTSLRNEAEARSDQVSAVRDDAVVDVFVAADNIERDLVIDKRVRNISRNETGFANTTRAAFDERVEFEVQIRTLGNRSQSNVTVRDSLPGGLVFVSGDDLRGSGENFGALSPNDSRTMRFTARVTTASDTTLTNTAFVRSAEVGERSDIARVIVEGDQGGVIERSLFLNKRVRNVSRQETAFRDFTQAAPGERVQFEVRFELLGNTGQTGVLLRDDFPSGALTFTGGNQNIIGSGINFGSLSAGTVRTELFDAVVRDGATGIVNNTARISSAQVGSVFDTAQVSITAPGAQTQLRKSAFNVTRNADATAVTARPGDVIRYTLTFRNTGNTTLNNILIEDDIRDILELSRISNLGGAVAVDNGVIKFPSVVSITPGSEISRTFEVTVFETGLIPANSDLVMTNVFGNEVRVRVERGQVGGVMIAPPRTGAAEWIPAVLAGLATLGYAVYRRRKNVMFRPGF